MANFNTHVGVSALAVSGVAAIAIKLSLIELTEAPWYILIGVLGGMLPDIDADNSKPVKRLFLFLSAMSCFGVLQLFQDCLKTDQLLLFLFATFFFVRHIIFFIFQKMTVHRGIFHSLLAAAFFGLIATCLSYYVIDLNILSAWYNGVFLFIGYIVHLCLDELFSVDLNNGRMKKSFGTALKLFNYNDLSSSLLMLIFVVFLFVAAPPSSYLIQAWEKTNLADIGFLRSFVVNDVNCLKSTIVAACFHKHLGR